jgi:2'-phosphotransferase
MSEEQAQQESTGHRDGNKKRKGCNRYKNKNNNKSNNYNNNDDDADHEINRLSRSLTWALRHGAVDLGLSMAPDGYVPVQDFLESSNPRFRGATLEKIQQIVATDAKKRFSLSGRPCKNLSSTTATTITTKAENMDGMENGAESSPTASTVLCIRANQGHSIKNQIDSNLLLTALSKEELQVMPTIVHGTYYQPYESIQKQGLKCMNRTHIHCASGLPNQDASVISGMRQSSQILIYIHASKCANDGIPFFKSENGVLMTPGVDHQGILPVKYFSHVVEAATGKILLDQR